MAEPVRNLPAEDAEPDPFRFGSRMRLVLGPEGELVEEWVPLTPDDLLDPQYGDEVVQDNVHGWLIMDVGQVLRRHFAEQQDVMVASDFKVFWSLAGLPNPAPDLAVFRKVERPELRRGSFDVLREQTRPCLVIEIASREPELRRNDFVVKVKIYEYAGVPEYLIFDPPSVLGGTVEITGYRLGTDRRYRRIEPDFQGRFLSETTGLLFGPLGRGIQVFDAVTGERIGSYLEEVKARREAEAEIARLRAELEAAKKTGL